MRCKENCNFFDYTAILPGYIPYSVVLWCVERIVISRGVYIRRGAHLIMLRPMGYRHGIHSVIDQHRCHRIAEPVYHQMGQTVPLIEVRQPASYGCGIDWVPVIQ